MKHIWLIIILFLNNSVIAQINGNDSFSHLNILSISTTDTTLNSYIKFDNQNSEILNVQFNNMPDFLMDYCGSDNLKLIRTKLKNNENKYYVVTYGSFDGWMQGFTIYEEKRRPAKEIRSELDIGYSYQNYTVEIFEIRPQWNDRSVMQHHSVAKAKYVKSKNVWRIYWMRANLKWTAYQPEPEVKEINRF